MAAVPPQIRYLQDGKALGAKSHRGFVATWNWLLSCLFHLKGGTGVSIRNKWRGVPVIDCKIIGGDGVDVSCAGDGAPYVISMDGEGTPTIPGPFEPVYTNGVLSGFANCIYCAERQFVECGTNGVMAISGVPASMDGYVVLTLPHNSSSSSSSGGTTVIDNANVSVAIEQSLPMNTSATVTKIPLYHVTDGVVDVDLRAVPTGVLAR